MLRVESTFDSEDPGNSEDPDPEVPWWMIVMPTGVALVACTAWLAPTRRGSEPSPASGSGPGSPPADKQEPPMSQNPAPGPGQLGDPGAIGPGVVGPGVIGPGVVGPGATGPGGYPLGPAPAYQSPHGGQVGGAYPSVYQPADMPEAASAPPHVGASGQQPQAGQMTYHGQPQAQAQPTNQTTTPREKVPLEGDNL